MGLKINFRDLAQDPSTKFHSFKTKFSSKYWRFQGKVFSKFHSRHIGAFAERKRFKFDLDHHPNLLLVKNEKCAQKDIETIRNLEQGLAISIKQKSFQERLDWTRGRFSGVAIGIIVRNGLIVEKVYVTPKGTRILVKRSELGLFARLRS